MKIVILLTALALPANSLSQEYPSRPVRMLVGYPPGGGMDTIARVLAPRLSSALGQQFVVENRPGASGGVAAEALAASPADGHVVMLAESGTLALPSVNPKVTLDPVRQWAPVAGVCTLPMAFVVNAAFPAASAQELVRVLKASPGRYSYASPGVGTLQHLAFELFKRQAGVDAQHVPYKGASAMMPDLMSGQVPIGVVSALAAAAQAKAGKIRTLAVTSAQRLGNAPEIPALAEILPGFEASPKVFVVAPAGTPPPVVAKLSGAVLAAVRSAEVAEAFARQGAAAMAAGPDELAAAIGAETRRWAQLVREANIRAD